MRVHKVRLRSTVDGRQGGGTLHRVLPISAVRTATLDWPHACSKLAQRLAAEPQVAQLEGPQRSRVLEGPTIRCPDRA
jgi:hypothetical protein